MIGSLSHLIREAAMQAILDGSEAITKTTLSAINLDRAAQDAAIQRARPARRPRGGKAA